MEERELLTRLENNGEEALFIGGSKIESLELKKTRQQAARPGGEPAWAGHPAEPAGLGAGLGWP